MKLAFFKGMTVSLCALTVGLGLTLASCATDTPPPPPPPPLLPPAPAGPPVALAPEVSDAASVYVAYVKTARAINADFKDGQSVQAELQLGATYQPKQLSRGAVAYGAIVAMQEPSFRAALRNYAAGDSTRADILNKILADPTYVTSIPGADNAARRVILALSSDGQSVYKAGASVKQAAYSIQHQDWSKEFVASRDERLALAKQNSVTPASVQSDESSRLLAAALTGKGLVSHATTGAPSDTGAAATNSPQGATPQTQSATNAPATGNSTTTQPVATADNSATPAADLAPDTTPPADFNSPNLFDAPYTSTVTHALAIAAIAILGEGGDNRADALSQLLDVNEGPDCFGMSKLSLYECLSVAKPYYEDVFCLGQHVLMDTGQCLGKMSSNALSFEPRHKIGFNDDGTVAHADAVAYLQPAPVKKCRKGRKCKTVAPAAASAAAAPADTPADSSDSSSDDSSDTTTTKHHKKKRHH